MRWTFGHTSLWVMVATMVVTVLPTGTASADGFVIPGFSKSSEKKPMLKLPVNTIGSSGVWGDLLVMHNYRVQRRVDKKEECRLLNPMDIVEERGSYDECCAALSGICEEKELEPLTGEVTLLIHGILRHSRSLGRVRTALDQAGLQPEPFDYPSTKATLEEAVDYLSTTLSNFGPEVTRINLVVHSMGGLLVRTYLKHAGEHADPRLHRLVMMGTPNDGARMATMLREFGLFKMVFGPAGQQLVDAEDGIARQLPTPPFEFAVIAGSRGNNSGWNPLIPGDDDGTVTVESTRLPGAKDFQTFVTTHALMLFRQDVADAAVRFLQTGSLHEDGHCEPVTAEDAAAEDVPAVESAATD